ncbi:N-6 DNA methylase [bacterium]|nr:N-6 DNA methylase [bacterium]
MKAFPSLRLEGGLLGADIIEQAFNAELPGQKPEDFNLNRRRGLIDEVASAFNEVRKRWQVLQERLSRLPDKDLATEETRRYFVIPFLQLLGFKPTYNPRAYVLDGETFAISHRAFENEDAPPIHIVGIKQPLSKVSPTGRPRLSPHALLQEFLNRSEWLWGIVTNGEIIRLLRQTTFIRQQAYLEFDLRQIIEEQRFEDFFLLYRLFHSTRFPKGLADASECLLEKYYQLSIEQGGRIRDKLRDGVEECMKILANAFLQHPKNDGLREWVKRESAEEFYRQLLKLIYRFLFLLVSEERGLISSDPIYLEHYSVSRLRKFADNPFAWDDEVDLWHSLRVLWKLFSDPELSKTFSLPPLNGELFQELVFDNCVISNKSLLSALQHIFYYRESPSSPQRKVNYSALDTEELGSVYESLLDYYPIIEEGNGKLRFELSPGLERKSTGSYYTPAVLVGELIKSALEPVLQERLSKARTKEEKERAILSLKICDPACGSGHFLLAAARRLGKELARIRKGEEEPPPEIVRSAIRDVISHCIYGVDKNPLAVELCRVALWIEGHAEGKPLTFLEHRIKCGDSLVGVMDLEVLKSGIPEDAFRPLRDDDKNTAEQAKNLNRREKYQIRLSFDAKAQLINVSKLIGELEKIPDDTPDDIRKKAKLYEELRKDKVREQLELACNLWTYAFFQKFEPRKEPITSGHIRDVLSGQQVRADLIGKAQAFAMKNRFFHWILEFPEVFQKGGFDVLLFNPPWEIAELEEQEFFALRDSEIANAPNKAERARLIRELKRKNPVLYEEYQTAFHYVNALNKFLRFSGRFPLTAVGRINLYSVFAELASQLLNPEGRAGIVIPTRIVTDHNNKDYFSEILHEKRLVSLYDFENRKIFFPAIHPQYRFSLLTLCGKGKAKETVFVFFCYQVSQLKDERRHIRLAPADFALFNPNTRTTPIFRSKADGELARAIYQRVPVLIDKAKGNNPWNVRFMQFINMSSDSHLFRERKDLEGEGFKLFGNRFVKGNAVYLPLYEAKMFWIYDHRYGTFEGKADRKDVHLVSPSFHQYTDPSFLALPWYWVSEDEVEKRLQGAKWQKNWLLCFRDITNATSERTAIFSVLPKVGVGNNAPLLMPFGARAKVPCLFADLNSLVFDWVARQKIGGVHLNFFYLEQLPVLPPSAYGKRDLLFIVPRVLELVYTAWDVKPFADDVWDSADEDLKSAIKKEWEENKMATGGNPPTPPPWLEVKGGIPFPPFRWDEKRRAVLQAELDAYFARLYGLNRKQLRYILDPADLTPGEVEDILSDREEVEDVLDEEGYRKRCEQSDYPSESFRVLKEKEIEQFGFYRTRHLILEAWEKLRNDAI